MQLLTASFFICSLAHAATESQSSKGPAAQKIASLKEELKEAKGQKRVKLIKKIAEMENKVLEHKLQSFR